MVVVYLQRTYNHWVDFHTKRHVNGCDALHAVGVVLHRFLVFLVISSAAVLLLLAQAMSDIDQMVEYIYMCTQRII